MSLSPDKITIDKQYNIISFFLSFFFGLVFTLIIAQFDSIVKGVQSVNPSTPPAICYLLVIIMGINFFRMFHGYVIALYDTERNPTHMGVMPYNPKELVFLVLYFLVPFLTIKAFINLSSITEYLNIFEPEEVAKKSNFIIIALFFFPQVFYLFWDILLWRPLRTKMESESEEIRKKAKEYMKFVERWLIIDIIAIVSLLILLILIEFDINSNAVLIAYSILLFGIIIADYFTFNKTYYFPLLNNLNK